MKQPPMKQRTMKQPTMSRGFSLLEVMVVVALMTILIGSVLSMITVTQQRARAEQVKVDIFQESREFADQFVRDLHQAGYPSTRMFDTSGWSPALASPAYTDSRIATGVIKIAANEIKFEGDVDGDGNVHTVDYQLTATGNNCPCLTRSDILKTGTAVFSNDVQNVQTAGTSADPLFIGYTSSGTTVTSADTTTSAGLQALATIKTVQFILKVKAPIVDTQTLVAPETTLGGQVTIGNCSLAATGQTNSC
jgi:prepilin-type N-terminal cleavage/methylation domain-containing protein